MAVANATITRSNLATATRIAYRKAAEDQLGSETLMHKWGEPRPMEMGSSELQLHRFDIGAQNVQTLTEGEFGGGSNFGDMTFKMRPSYYGDFVTVSKETNMEVYSNYKAGLAESLGSRAALSIDAIHKAVFDGASGTIGISSPVTPHLSRSTINQLTTLLGDKNVKGGESDGMFGMVVSRLAAYDLINDPTAGAVLDLIKNLSAKEAMKGTTSEVITETGGARVYATNLVTAPSSAKRRCYVFGKNGYAHTYYPGEAPEFGDRQLRSFDMITHMEPKGSLMNPMGRIYMSMAYTLTLGVAWLDMVNYRVSIFDADVTIGV